MMMVEQATTATIGEWVAMRAALWPHASRLELEREAMHMLILTDSLQNEIKNCVKVCDGTYRSTRSPF